MPTVRIRLTGSQDQSDALIATLHGLDEIERIEEVDDLVPRLRDDSSSAGLPDDGGGDAHCIEVDVPDEDKASLVRRLAEIHAVEYGVAVEIVDRF